MGIIRNAQLSEIPIYGSSRLGQYQANGKEDLFAIRSGQRRYEFSNHLGNVLVTLNDAGNVLSYSDYYPFGLTMEDRSWSGVEGGKEYRYGFSGHEKDDDLKGSRSTYDMGARLYNPSIGRTPSIDPKFQLFPSISPYSYAGNNPLYYIDPDGAVIEPYHKSWGYGWFSWITYPNFLGGVTGSHGETFHKVKTKMVGASDIFRKVYDQLENSTNHFRY
ncbi:RHS repeat domain-containing protein [Flammeovirga sp. EKP202]|uniref:RHS repeat domain-containing protein n=1 Tax=Flammeovirga sp. EKP202 TaxID=2770592 RepID=UPI00165F1E6A|nr:RHS repeat-associated core domain-containing protein [Flammeovirga sp. EKP202]MBD0401486.1 RHS repeat-associated core domain-containing protein [Flammeovirga sp. EKP202]